MNSTHPSPAPAPPRPNRGLPVEQWPESLAILRHLCTHSTPRSIRQIAMAVDAPEISTRNRLARLEIAGTVIAQRAPVATPSGKPSVGMHYGITQFGRDCAGATVCSMTSSPPTNLWERASSVFAWGATQGNGR